MVAYSFKAQFAARILDETKGGTIRGDRRRHAHPGEEVQLYTGMRTRQCRLIARKTCIAVDPIMLDFGRRQIIVGGLIVRGDEPIGAFARFDGFPDFSEMRRFWCGDAAFSMVFEGWHIRWSAFPEAVVPTNSPSSSKGDTT